MPNFDDMKHKGQCDVCGKETDVVVCASTMGAMSNAYCKDCLSKHLEPYGNIVAYVSCAGIYPDDFDSKYVDYIKCMLNELGKTDEEFISDVKESNREFAEWCKDMEEFTDDECGE